jgi:heme-degrading monooxygenase HmoA
MIAVIFEVWPVEGRVNAYFDLAAVLRPLLEAVEGFVSIERFESLMTKEMYLSLSFRRNEAPGDSQSAHGQACLVS